MFQPRTVGQYRVMEFLSDRFFLEDCLIWPLSRDGLVLEDRDGARIAFRWEHGQIVECPVPEEGNIQAIRNFFTYLHFRYPAAEQQTFEAKTELWLDTPMGLTYRQALGLGPNLFRHYLTQPIPDTGDVLRMVSKGYVSIGEYSSILLWCLDGHVKDTHVAGNIRDGENLYAELVIRYGAVGALTYPFFLAE